jgi:hypothetical protein
MGAKLIWAQIWTNSVWFGILQIIQNLWTIRRSYNYKRCSKLHLLPPWIFLNFFSVSSYFYWAIFVLEMFLIRKMPIRAFTPPGAMRRARSPPGLHIPVLARRQSNAVWASPDRNAPVRAPRPLLLHAVVTRLTAATQHRTSLRCRTWKPSPSWCTA